MNLDPGGIVAWLVVGAIAGWLAGQFMKGGGYGLVGDIIVGIIGAFIGGFVLTRARHRRLGWPHRLDRRRLHRRRHPDRRFARALAAPKPGVGSGRSRSG